MSGPCPEAAQVPAILALPATDARRVHVDRCPRCRAIAANYNEFVAPGAPVPSTDLEDADRRLRAALLREGGPPPLPAEGAGVSGAAAPQAPPGGHSASDRARPPRHRPRAAGLPARWRWAAAAAVAATVVAAALLWPGSPAVRQTVLREPPGPNGGSGAAVPVLAAPRSVAGQGIELRWEAVRDADAYELVLYSVALDELARVGPVHQTQLLLTRADVPAAVASGTPLLVRVLALRQGAVLGTSRAASLLTPP